MPGENYEWKDKIMCDGIREGSKKRSVQISFINMNLVTKVREIYHKTEHLYQGCYAQLMYKKAARWVCVREVHPDGFVVEMMPEEFEFAGGV